MAWYMRAVAAGMHFKTSGVNSRSETLTTSVLRCSAVTWSCISSSTSSKSTRIWLMLLPLRACSCRISSTCRSSIRLRSLTSARRGLETMSDMGSGLGGFGAVLLSHRLGQLVFLELGLHGGRILGFGDDFLS